jgi:hypothetical protein
MSRLSQEKVKHIFAFRYSPRISKACDIPIAALSLQDIFARLSSLSLFLSIIVSPPFQFTLMPDAVLVREQGDGGSVIDSDIVGGRMGLLL